MVASEMQKCFNPIRGIVEIGREFSYTEAGTSCTAPRACYNMSPDCFRVADKYKPITAVKVNCSADQGTWFLNDVFGELDDRTR